MTWHRKQVSGTNQPLRNGAGDTFTRLGVTQTVKSIRIVPHCHDVGIDKAGQPETIDLSYLEMLHSGGSLYSGPPVRANLELREFRLLAS